MSINSKNPITKLKKLLFQDDESFKTYWEKQQQKGFAAYTAVKVIWAIFVFVFWSVVFINFKGRFFGWEGSGAIIAAVLIGFFGGILSSAMTWMINEAKYREIKDNTRNI